MNKFLQAESIEQLVMCNKKSKRKNASQPPDDRMDQMDYAQQLKGNIAVDFNLNNINDATESMTQSITESSTDATPSSPSPAATKHCSTKTQANQSTVNDHQQMPKTIHLEQLKTSGKRKAGRILRHIKKIKEKLNCTEQHALDLMADKKKIRYSRATANRLSLEDYLSKENGLRNKLKVRCLQLMFLQVVVGKH